MKTVTLGNSTFQVLKQDHFRVLAKDTDGDCFILPKSLLKEFAK